MAERAGLLPLAGLPPVSVLDKHPAKFGFPILEAIRPILASEAPAGRMLDPFAGTGRVHTFANSDRQTVGVELEPEWAANDPRTIVGDALHLPFPDDSFEAVVTSCCYGNRMADHHEAKDLSVRNTYRHTLGRQLTKGSSAAMQWGHDYREFHEAAWVEARRTLRPGGLFVLNISNHIRKGQEERVMEWHLSFLMGEGFGLISACSIQTSRLRFGENHQARVPSEFVLAFRTP